MFCLLFFSYCKVDSDTNQIVEEIIGNEATCWQSSIYEHSRESSSIVVGLPDYNLDSNSTVFKMNILYIYIYKSNIGNINKLYR